MGPALILWILAGMEPIDAAFTDLVPRLRWVPEFRAGSKDSQLRRASWIGAKREPELRNRGALPRVAPGLYHAAQARPGPYQGTEHQAFQRPTSQFSTPCLGRVARRSNTASSREHASL